MKKLVVISTLLLAACGSIETGNVGIRTQFGTVVKEELQPGFYTAIISHVNEYSIKEIGVDLNDMQPKAKDNLSLKDMDVTVFYRVTPGKVRDLAIKYAGQSAKAADSSTYFPAFHLVANVARNSVYEEVAKNESLSMHLNREAMAAAILNDIQKTLSANDPETFTVTRVLIRGVTTDPTIEASIQQAVANQKRLEAMRVQVEIAKQEAEIEVTKARGMAQAQQIINATLTREYLQHEANEVMKKFAEKGGVTTVVLPANLQPLITMPIK